MAGAPKARRAIKNGLIVTHCRLAKRKRQYL